MAVEDEGRGAGRVAMRGLTSPDAAAGREAREGGGAMTARAPQSRRASMIG